MLPLYKNLKITKRIAIRYNYQFFLYFISKMQIIAPGKSIDILIFEYIS
jgi:hypothetical protein